MVPKRWSPGACLLILDKCMCRKAPVPPTACISFKNAVRLGGGGGQTPPFICAVALYLCILTYSIDKKCMGDQI